MSTQLILYPQSYDGTYSFINTSEFVVDGLNFGTMNTSPTAWATGGIDNYLFSLTTPPVVNTWYRWSGTPGDASAYALQTAGNLVLNSVAPFSINGVYQRLSGLTVGAVYNLTVDMIPGAGGLQLRAHNLSNNSLIASTPLSTLASSAQVSLSFTAQTPTDTISIVYYNFAASDLTITTISTSNTPGGPTGVYTDLNDGQVICDLYEEEDIPLTLSIDDFKNVAEQVKSYSKDFNLPATKRNNQIFNNMFEVTRADDGLIFNPYVKTKCVLKQDGFLLFEGYLRMINIKEDEGEISYNVNLYSEVVAFADTLKELTFSDLDFEELEHDYVISNIKKSWESVGLGNGLILTNPLPTSSFAYDASIGVNNTQVLKYPFINWTNQITPAVALDKLEVAFRPCIQLKYLINKIFGNTQFSYTSAFFDSADFEKLFMDFNWGENENGATPDVGNYLLQEDSGASSYYIDETSYNAASKLRFNLTQAGANTYWDNTNYKYVSPVNNWNVTCTFEIYLENTENGSRSNNVRIAKFTSGGQHLETFFFDNSSISYGSSRFKVFGGTFSTILQADEYIQAQSIVISSGDIRMGIAGSCGYLTTCSSNLEFTSTNISSQAWVLLNAQRGELGQWDFLKGIMTMFNLVSMADEDNPNNILIEPYSHAFINNTVGTTLASRSIQHDWTTKVDVSQMELKTLTDLNKMTTFKFVEDEDDYTFNVYKAATSGHLYGSKVMTAATSSSSGLPTMLVGEKEIIAEPFAATISKALSSAAGFSDFVVPVAYARAEDGTCSAFKNSPRIFYNNLVVVPTSSFSVPAQNGEAAETITYFLQFSHMSDIPAILSDSDFVFESVQLFPGVATNIPINNLYQTYWSPYFNQLYSPDTRIMNLKVNLTPADIASFSFTDTVFIKNKTFRVNKIEYKPNELAKVEFILIP